MSHHIAKVMEEFSSLGIVSIPLHGKIPMLTGWTKLGVPTPAQIRKWLELYREFNVGIVLGPNSRLLCIDVDPRNGGLDWYEEHEALFIDGVHELSGRGDGGRHIYYRSRYEVDWAKKTIAKGIDFLARGSQVVAAPSIHPDTNRPYSYVDEALVDLGPEGIPFIEDNPAVMDLCSNAIRKPKAVTTTAVKVYRDTVTSADHEKLKNMLTRLDPHKGRHSQIGSWIISAISVGMDEAEVADWAQEWLWEMGRHPEEQPQEVANWIKVAHEKVDSGELWRDPSLCTEELLDVTAPESKTKTVVGVPAEERMRQDADVQAKSMKTSEGRINAFLTQKTSTLGSLTDTDMIYANGRAYTQEDVEAVGATALMSRASLDQEACAHAQRDKKGELRFDTSYNISLLMQTQAGVKGTVKYDAFANRLMVTGRPAWLQRGRMSEQGTPFTDGHEAVLKMYLEQLCGGVPISSSAFASALTAQTQMASYDPLQEYVKSLTWDGVPRVDNLCEEYLSCVDDSPAYLKMVSKVWMLSTVGRAMHPGCKVDTVPVMSSVTQGVGKSTAVAILGGQYAGELGDDIHNKDTLQAMQGKWVIEVSELDALRRHEVESIKAFITRTTDYFRVPYGRHSEEKPRRCIFVGTSNNSKPLKDSTGNRRFLMLTIGGKIDREKLIKDRDQLYAEAWQRLQNGETWIMSDAENEFATRAQAQRMDFDHVTPIAVRCAIELFKQHKSYTLEQIIIHVFKVKSAADVRAYEAARIRKSLQSVGFVEKNGQWKMGRIDPTMESSAVAMGIDMSWVDEYAPEARERGTIGKRSAPMPAPTQEPNPSVKPVSTPPVGPQNATADLISEDSFY